MDRNEDLPSPSPSPDPVATREGGVDRNTSGNTSTGAAAPSPPARVAWIETFTFTSTERLLKSPPARVAWIETFCTFHACYVEAVATREGGVDRNASASRLGCPWGVATREGGVDRNY